MYYKCLVNMDKYFTENQLSDGNFDFYKHKKLKVRFKFNKSYYGNIYFTKADDMNIVRVSIMKRGTSLKADRVLYSGRGQVNIFEQIYIINAFNNTFLINVTSLYLLEKVFIKSVKSYSFVNKEGVNYLNKLLYFNDFDSIENVDRVLNILKFKKPWLKICKKNPINMYALLELIIEKLIFKGYITDYIDENSTDFDIENCFSYKQSYSTQTMLINIRDYMYFCKIMIDKY